MAPSDFLPVYMLCGCVFAGMVQLAVAFAPELFLDIFQKKDDDLRGFMTPLPDMGELLYNFVWVLFCWPIAAIAVIIVLYFGPPDTW